MFLVKKNSKVREAFIYREKTNCLKGNETEKEKK